MIVNSNFQSLFWAGFECTSAKTADFNHLDMLSHTRHDELCQEDYEMLKNIGIQTVREGLSWSKIDKGNHRYDFSRYEKMMQIAEKAHVQQIWDLNHFDYPDDIDPFTDEFIERFCEYAIQCVSLIRRYQHNTLYIVPMNEISFFAWIGADQGAWAPYTHGSLNGSRFKIQMIKATLLAMKAIKKTDPNVKFIHVDPIMWRKSLDNKSEKAHAFVDAFNNHVRFNVWDTIIGKINPELGGSPDYVDFIGLNYYLHNQEWVFEDKTGQLHFQMMDWDSPIRLPFSQIVQEVYTRYHKPIIITETGSYQTYRIKWWNRILKEVDDTLKAGLPLSGICAYPVLDRLNSINFLLAKSGLWDFKQSDSTCKRIPHRKTLHLISQWISHHQPLGDTHTNT